MPLPNVDIPTITLSEPVEYNGETIEQLTMRKPKVRDLKLLPSGLNDQDREITLLANLCDQSPEALEELTLGDYADLQQIYQSLTAGKLSI